MDIRFVDSPLQNLNICSQMARMQIANCKYIFCTIIYEQLGFTSPLIGPFQDYKLFSPQHLFGDKQKGGKYDEKLP